MTGKSVKKSAIAVRREQVGELYLKGMTAAAIAEQLGVSRRTVDRDLKTAYDAWSASRAEAIETVQAQELAALHLLAREAWRGWELSKQEGVSEKLSKAEDEKQTPSAARGAGQGNAGQAGKAGGVKKRAERTTRSQHGDPRFLILVMKCIERRARLLEGASPSEDFMMGARVTFSEVLDQVTRDPEYLAFCRMKAAEIGYEELPDERRVP